MSEPRNVHLLLSSEDIIEIALVLSETDRGHAYDKLWAAIGYLSCWGNTPSMTYPTVTIYRDRGTDLVAVYSREDGSNGYTIGAVWHEDHYGFHS